ncbi:MAG: GldG family protein [Byssovorax sp.]
MRLSPAFLLLAASGLSACGAPPAAAPTSTPAPAALPPIAAPPPDPCSQAAGPLFASLDRPVVVTAYLSHGTPALDAFGRDLRALLEQEAQGAQGKLVVHIVDDPKGEDRQAALDDGLIEGTFGQADADNANRATIVKGFLGLSLRLGGEKEAMPQLDPGERAGMRFWILNKIRELRDQTQHRRYRIGVLTGHDELSLAEPSMVARSQGHNPSLRGVMEQALPAYAYEDVDLQGGAAPVDPGLTALIITQPERDLTTKELRRIDQFLMLGDKTLLVYAGAVNIRAADATITARLSAHGLEALSGGYGIELEKAAILDWKGAIRIPVNAENKIIELTYPPVLHAETDDKATAESRRLDPTFAGFFRLAELVFPFPSPLVPHPERQPGATMTVVARTTPTASTLRAEPVAFAITNEWRDRGSIGPQTIAIALEGKIKSAFGPGAAEGVTLPAETQGGPSRLLWISASQFLVNPMARAGNPPPTPPQMAMMGPPPGDDDLQMLSIPYAKNFLVTTILAFKNNLDWAANPPALSACAARPLAPR